MNAQRMPAAVSSVTSTATRLYRSDTRWRYAAETAAIGLAVMGVLSYSSSTPRSARPAPPPVSPSSYTPTNANGSTAFTSGQYGPPPPQHFTPQHGFGTPSPVVSSQTGRIQVPASTLQQIQTQSGGAVVPLGIEVEPVKVVPTVRPEDAVVTETEEREFGTFSKPQSQRKKPDFVEQPTAAPSSREP